MYGEEGNEVRVGIDIGGMSVKIGLVDKQGIATKSVIKTASASQTPYELIEQMADAVSSLLRKTV